MTILRRDQRSNRDPSDSLGEAPLDPWIEGLLEETARVQHGRRLGAITTWSAFAWIGFPFVEGLLVGHILPWPAAVHLAVVAPIGFAAAWVVTTATSRLIGEAAAVAAVLVAVTAILFGHRMDPQIDTARAWLDMLALVPIVHLGIGLRPSIVGSAIGAAAGVALLIPGVASAFPAQAPTAITVLAAIAAISVIGGQLVERDLQRVTVDRLLSEINAHRLTHRNDELRVLSQVDTLTGLANRRTIDDHLRHLAERLHDGGTPIALMMVDVDHFKQFNDHYGHPAGDRCLVDVAAAVRDQVRRKDDLVGRFGGEEFLVVLPGTDLPGALRVAERIRAAVEARRIEHGLNPSAGVVTISLGCAAGRLGPGLTIEDLLRVADTQLYAAKNAGRNRVRPAPREGAAQPVARHRRSAA